MNDEEYPLDEIIQSNPKLKSLNDEIKKLFEGRKNKKIALIPLSNSQDVEII